MKLIIDCGESEIFDLDVTPELTLKELKSKIGETVDIEGGFLVSYGSRILDDEAETLESLEIADFATLSCTGRLMGGKVHGSLARAGKVRAQTPKVDKQEKKKKKRGRAFRRMQYNRRYLTQTTGPGRKRGPNSNSA